MVSPSESQSPEAEPRPPDPASRKGLGLAVATVPSGGPSEQGPAPPESGKSLAAGSGQVTSVCRKDPLATKCGQGGTPDPSKGEETDLEELVQLGGRVPH